MFLSHAFRNRLLSSMPEILDAGHHFGTSADTNCRRADGTEPRGTDHIALFLHTPK